MPRAFAKLLILLIAGMAIFAMFMYKFKYEQMRSIVEGAGLDAVDRYLHRSHIVSSLPQIGVDNSLFERPLTSWVNITDFWLFSAFPCSDGMAEFCAIGFGPNRTPRFDCSIWFDLGRDLVSVTGSFSFVETEVGPEFTTYVFKCSLDDVEPIYQAPYMFDIKLPDRSSKVFIPVQKPRSIQGNNRYALCLYPDRTGNEWKSLIEFLSYHEIIGFTDIIAYDNGINYGFFDKVKSLIRAKNGTFQSLSVIRWNLPVDNVALSNYLVEVDCIQKTTKFADFAAVLRSNQYLSLRDGFRVDNFLKSLDNMKPFSTRLQAQRCCMDTMDDRRSEKTYPVILRKTLCIPDKEKQQLFVYKPGPNSNIPTQLDVNAELLVYANCHGLPLSDLALAPVFSMWKYLASLQKSSLLRQWNEKGVFPN